MKALFMSDFHLGSPIFRLRNLLEILSDPSYDEIFLVGDIFDTWEKKFSKIASEHSAFIQTIDRVSNEKPVHFIKGNHDPDITELAQYWPAVKFAPLLEGSKYHGVEFEGGIIVHGNMFDKLALKYEWVTRWFYYLHMFCERVFKFNLQEFLRVSVLSISSKSDKEYFLDLIGDIEESSIEEYKGVFKFLLMGHTHYPKLISIQRGIIEGTQNPDVFQYVNCGDWIVNYSYVVYEDGVFNVIK